MKGPRINLVTEEENKSLAASKSEIVDEKKVVHRVADGKCHQEEDQKIVDINGKLKHLTSTVSNEISGTLSPSEIIAKIIFDLRQANVPLLPSSILPVLIQFTIGLDD